ncbi:CGNR zinc finger domain-containing protein [Kitasatospora sp. NPDC058032]
MLLDAGGRRRWCSPATCGSAPRRAAGRPTGAPPEPPHLPFHPTP